MKRVYEIIGNHSEGLHHNFRIGDKVIIETSGGYGVPVTAKRISDGILQHISFSDYGVPRQDLWYDEFTKKITVREANCDRRVANSTAIKNIYVNESKKCVAVKFEDEDVKVIHCSENDSFDVYVGVALAIAKKAFGSSEKFHNKVDRILKKGNK